ncbi:MAG: DUF6527 family protein [Lutibacter sp.]
MMTLNHKFVEKIPSEIEEEVLYISIPFEIAIHKCCCGCGNEVVTPLAPTQWSLTFDGESVTLDPSIGSWNLNCQSHYFIRKNNVVWSRMYDDNEIEKVRKSDHEDNIRYFEGRNDDTNKIIKEKIKKVDYNDNLENIEVKNNKKFKLKIEEKKKTFLKSLFSMWISK